MDTRKRRSPYKQPAASPAPPAPSPDTKRQHYATGAQRDALPLALYSVCPAAIEVLAEVCAEGDTKYGLFDWTRGMPSATTLAHVEAHILAYRKGDRSEPHLEHAFWGLMAIFHQKRLCCHHLTYAEMEKEDQAYAEVNRRD